MSTAHRLRDVAQRLDALAPEYPTVLFLDDAGMVLDTGNADAAPWVGKHHAEVPVGPWGRKVYAGVDPLVVLGRKPGTDAPPDPEAP